MHTHMCMREGRAREREKEGKLKERWNEGGKEGRPNILLLKYDHGKTNFNPRITFIYFYRVN